MVPPVSPRFLVFTRLGLFSGGREGHRPSAGRVALLSEAGPGDAAVFLVPEASPAGSSGLAPDPCGACGPWRMRPEKPDLPKAFSPSNRPGGCCRHALLTTTSILMQAVRRKHPEVGAALLASPADPNAADRKGKASRDVARRGHRPAIEGIVPWQGPRLRTRATFPRERSPPTTPRSP